MKLKTYLTLYTNTSSKQIKDLNVKAEAVKLLEENIGISLCDLEFVNGFLAMTPKAQATTKILAKATQYLFTI